MSTRELWIQLLRNDPTVGDLLCFTRLAEREVNAGRKMQTWRTAVRKIVEEQFAACLGTSIVALSEHLQGDTSPKNHTQRAYYSRARLAVEVFARFRDDPLSLRSLIGRVTRTREAEDRRVAPVKNALVVELEQHADALRRIADRLAQPVNAAPLDD